jgi:hypothetical protein
MSYVQKRPKGARTLVHEGQTYYWLTGTKFTKINGPDKSRNVHNANLVRINSVVFASAQHQGDERHGAVQPHHIAAYIQTFWNEPDAVDAQTPQYEHADPTKTPDYEPYDPWKNRFLYD